MSDQGPGAFSTVVRVCIAALLVAGGTYFLGHGISGLADVGRLLIGAALFLAASIVLGPPIAGWLARPSGKLFFPDEHFDRPPPAYSLAESKVMKEKFEEAMRLYETIADEHPGEIEPYVAMIRIAVVHLNDLKRADQIFSRGLERLDREESRKSLHRMYRGIRSMKEEQPEWTRAHLLSLERDAAPPS